MVLFKRLFTSLALGVSLLAGLSSCSDREGDCKPESTSAASPAPAFVPEFTHPDEVKHKTVGVWTGTVADGLAKDHFPEAPAEQYTRLSDMVLALVNGKIDFFPLEEPQARVLQLRRPDVCIMSDEMVEVWNYAFAFPRSGSALRDAFSAEIRQCVADGTVEQLKKKWFAKDASAPKMTPRKPGSKGVLRIGTVPEVEPFTYLQNGRFVGMDLDLAAGVAEKLGYSVEFVLLDFASFIEALNTGKVDMVASCITVTEERKEQILFADSHYLGGCVLVVRNMASPTDEAGSNWLQRSWKELCASFDRTFVREERWKLVLKGLGVTIIITLGATALGTLLAFPVWLVRTARSRVLQGIGRAYVSLMQGTPILVILMILYYIIFAKVDIDAIIVAIIGFGLNLSAYAGEMLRTGIESVPRGQREAALALGFTRFQTFRKVVMPQALRQILPIYRGEFVNLLKTTSIVGYIAIQDLTKMSDIIRSRTYEAFFPLIATAVIYFLTATALAAVLNYMEYRLNPKNRRSLG